MTLTRGFIRDAATQPSDARLMDLARIVTNTDGTARTGVLGELPANLLIAQGTMNVNVAAAAFAVSRAKSAGVSIFTNDGNVLVPISTAPVSNSRITVIWVKHNDNTQGDANALPVFGTTDGAAAATPLTPAIPTGAAELGTLRVYAGTTAANGGSNLLTQTYQMTCMQGGVVSFRTKAELDLWTNANDGQLAVIKGDADPLNGYYARRAGTWRRLLEVKTRVQIDAANSTPVLTAQYGRGKQVGNNTSQITKAVVFPAAFASMPFVQVTAIGYRNAGAYNDTALNASVNVAAAFLTSTTGFSVALNQIGATLSSAFDWYYSWSAVGVAP